MLKPLLKAAILMALVWPAAAFAQDSLTLKQSVDLVLNNNQQVQIAAESAVGADLRIRESRSLYWPQASVSGSYIRMSLFSEMSMEFLGQTYNFKFGLPNNYDLRASVTEQVFNWGRTARAIEMSKAGLDLANDGVALTKQALSYQVVPLFYGTVFFKEAIKVLDDNISAFEKKQSVMEERFQAGLLSAFDLDLVKVQISSLRAQKIDFQNGITKFRIAFNALAGRSPDAAFEPAAELVYEPLNLDEDALVREAFSGRTEFQQVAHQLSLGQASLDLAKTGDKPTVVASFNYEFRNGYMPEMEKIRGNWTALLSVSYPVFDGFRVRAQVAQAESSLRAAEMKKTDLERNVVMEIGSVVADLRAAEQKLELEKLKIKQADEALRIAEERYQNGLLSATDLVDAQNSAEGARLNYLQLIYNHTLSRYSLFRSVGRQI